MVEEHQENISVERFLRWTCNGIRSRSRQKRMAIREFMKTQEYMELIDSQRTFVCISVEPYGRITIFTDSSYNSMMSWIKDMVRSQPAYRLYVNGKLIPETGVLYDVGVARYQDSRAQAAYDGLKSNNIVE